MQWTGVCGVLEADVIYAGAMAFPLIEETFSKIRDRARGAFLLLKFLDDIKQTSGNRRRGDVDSL